METRTGQFPSPRRTRRWSYRSKTNPLLLGRSGLPILLLAGCDAGPMWLAARPVSVRLENRTDALVGISVILGADEDVARTVLSETGAKLEVTVAAGERRTFALPCAALHIVALESARMFALGEPHAETDALRLAEDFDCRDSVVFLFHGSQFRSDFDVEVEVRRDVRREQVKPNDNLLASFGTIRRHE